MVFIAISIWPGALVTMASLAPPTTSLERSIYLSIPNRETETETETVTERERDKETERGRETVRER